MTARLLRREPTSRTVWLVAALGLVPVALVMWMAISEGRFAESWLTVLANVAYAIALIAFILSGALIVSRQPGNVIGWLLIIPGLALSSSELAFTWLVGFDPPPTIVDLPLWLALWFTNWSWILLIFPIFHLLLTFPGGELLTPRWRWVVWGEGALMAIMVGAVTFSDRLQVVNDEDVTLWSVPNPVGFIPDDSFGATFGVLWSSALVGLTVAGVTAFVRRFRAGDREQRQQLKWPLYAAGLFGMVYGFTAVFGGVIGPDPLFGLTVAAIPVSVAVAVLRYRLYEIDRIVSRTVTYALVVLLLVAVSGAVALALGAIVGRNNPVAVAAATLGAAALFNPARHRVRRWVDRKFNRSRYDAERVMDSFVATLRDRLDTDEVVEGWVEVVATTMQPSTVGAWIRS